MKIIEKINEKKVLFLTIAYWKNLIWGAGKIALAIISHSAQLFISAFYTLGIGLARRSKVKESKKSEYNRYKFIGVMVLISSLIYVAYSLYGYIYGMKANYHMYIAIGIAAFSFVDLTLSIIGVVKTRKSQEIQAIIFKLMNLATSLISMALTQTALLSFTMDGDISKPCGMGGITFGGMASGIGIYMIVYIVKNKEKIIE